MLSYYYHYEYRSNCCTISCGIQNQLSNKIFKNKIPKTAILYIKTWELPYFSDHKTHWTIRRTLIFSLDILEKKMMNVF